MPPAEQTQGTIDSAPCPWCKKAHKFSGFADYGIQPFDARYQCVDDATGPGCKRFFVIARTLPTTLIWLKRAP